jgi:hypothetical protein
MLEWLVNTIAAGINTSNEDRIVGFSIDPPNALYSSPNTEVNRVGYPHLHWGVSELAL